MKTLQKKIQLIVILSLFALFIIPQITFAEGGFMSGRVTKSDGITSIAGVKVRAYRMITGDQKGDVGGSTTKLNGEYIIENLFSGQYTVVAFLSGYIEATKINVSVSNNKVTEDINFILIEGNNISGKVTELDGVTPISGVQISIDGSDKIPEDATDTDEEGKYHIDQIPSDQYWIRAKKDGYVMQVTLPTNIGEGQEITDLNFVLEKAATISGTVMVENTNTPIEKAAVFAGSEDRVYAYEITDVNGNYLLRGLPSGTCKIVIGAKDYLPFSYEIDLTRGENVTNKNFYLQPVE